MLINRITRPAGQPVPAIVPAGVLQGRAEYNIGNAYSPTPIWWKVILAPLASAWGGKETDLNAVSLQMADSWARIRTGDGATPAMYVTWPAVGGSIWCFGQSVSVDAFPSPSQLSVGLPGPSWGVIIDDEPLETGMRENWLGLGIVGQIPQMGSATFLVPPYAKAVNITGDQPAFAVDARQFSANQVQGWGVTTLTNLGTGNGARLVLHPGAVELRLTQFTALTKTVHLVWEIAP